MKRQYDGKNRTTPRLVSYLDSAKMIGYNPVHDGKSQAGTGCLGGKEWIKDVAQYLRGDSLTAVTDRHHYRIPIMRSR